MVSPSEDSSAGFHEQLLKLYTDPGIWRFALRRAGHRDLAEDAIQETYYSVSRVKNPERIRDVRAFYCRALSHEISHQRGQELASGPGLAGLPGATTVTGPGACAVITGAGGVPGVTMSRYSLG